MHFVKENAWTFSWNGKWKIPFTVFERRALCFSTFKNHKLKIKLCWVGAHGINKSAFFIPFNLSEENFLNFCVSSQCIMYWIHFQKIPLLHIKKHYFIHMFLVFKTIIESLQCILQSFGHLWGNFYTKFVFVRILHA